MSVEVVLDEADKKRYDPFEVRNKKEGYEYRLLNKNARNLERRSWEGYEIVQGNDPEKLANLGASTPMKKGEDVDTTRRFQDVILARIPKALADKKRAATKDIARRRDAATVAEFLNATGGLGFKGEGGGGWKGSMTEAQFEAAAGGKK